MFLLLFTLLYRLTPLMFIMLDSQAHTSTGSQLFFSTDHRYLMSNDYRLSLQVFYLWRHVSSTAPPLILWWSNLEILVRPLHRNSPFIGELRCQAIQTEHGPYITERTQKQSILWDVYVTDYFTPLFFIYRVGILQEMLTYNLSCLVHDHYLINDH
jgi:hypothetical protein